MTRASRLLLVAMALLTASQVAGETLRVATFNTELQRRGPGLLLRDILRGEDPQIDAVVAVLTETRPDIVALQSFDYDLTSVALSTFQQILRDAGLDYPHAFSARPNTGMITGLDMDGNGRRAEARDAQGYGFFSGQGGMAILSRYPIVTEDVRDFSDMLWQDFPAALLPHVDGQPFPSEQAQAAQRLPTTGHWVVPVEVPDLGRVTLMTFHASPPVFDGPEDRNGRRNHDEITFWLQFLDGAFGFPPEDQFILLGDFNLDPDDGDGIKAAIRRVLNDPRLQDPRPSSAGSEAITGDPFDTADWDDPVPGNLRVDYVLPSRDFTVTASGVHWPEAPVGDTAEMASRHRLVWVDLAY